MKVPPLTDSLLILAAVVSATLALARSRDVPLVTKAIAQGAAPVHSTPPRREATPRTPPVRSPFRLDGRIPSRRYGEAPVDLPLEETRPQATVYAVVVKALVGGPPWSAVLGGLPGEAGERVVRVGDRHGPVLIDRVGGDGVRLVTSDTSWVVRLPERQP